MNYLKLIGVLIDHQVEFIIVGGVAAVLQGAPVQTFDLDIVHRRTSENAERLQSALLEINATYRHHHNEISPAKKHLLSEGHQLLKSDFGDIDVLGTIDNRRSYDDLFPFSQEMNYFDGFIHVLSLEELIKVKERTGRPKDVLMIPILLAALHVEEE